MYAVGHLALGYVSGKTASKILKVNINVPLLFLASVLLDVDLLIPGLEHRGPVHSVIVSCLLFLPAFVFFGKGAIPYFVALVQHILVGDYITGGTQLFWPVTSSWYSLGIEVTSLTNVLVEWVLFLTSITVMFKTRDVWLLFQRHPSNMVLSVPVLSILLPTFLGFPIYVPLELVVPHLIYMALFVFSIILDWKAILTKI